ncbi:MAG: mtDNA inheritance, partitioning of the mitochondrial organelle [Piccolia ochrophora]|nr:MAG: mtDNA inheritance, partitioning of the mitochondrial organelle [Piccolia ochrophora]
MREIVTLQLGQKSNYVATHFWNAQESYFTYSAEQESPIDHDVHFRPGIGADGTETFTPRTLIYDLKGGFGTLRKINALYELNNESSPSPSLWDGPSSTQKQPVIEESPYQRSLNQGLQPPSLSTSTVRYWSDFNRVFYHPRSIVQLNDYELNSSLLPFERWNLGEELFDSLDKEHDLIDRDLRPFAEECDQLQGLQIITEADNAWGGFAGRYLDRLRDEFGKLTLWVWALQDSGRTSRPQELVKRVNTARSLESISAQSSVYVPLSDPPCSLPGYVSIEPGSQWHSSALLATAVETMTLPSRLRAAGGTRSTFVDIAGFLNTNGTQKVAQLQLQVMDPDEMSATDKATAQSDFARLDARIDEADDPREATACLTTFDMDLFPEHIDTSERKGSKKPHVFAQVEMIRGDTARSTHNDDGDPRMMLRQRATELPAINRFRTPVRFPKLDSFPSIYSQNSIQSGGVTAQTALLTSTTVANYVKSVQRFAGRSVGVEEREALMNGLSELAEAYQHGWESGSDEDED